MAVDGASGAVLGFVEGGFEGLGGRGDDAGLGAEDEGARTG